MKTLFLVPLVSFFSPLVLGGASDINTQFDTITQKKIQETPLFTMDDVPKTFSTLFGGDQAETILMYNNLYSKNSDDIYTTLTHIKYPLIYPEILDYLTLDIFGLQKKIKFSMREKSYFSSKNIIFILRNDENKIILAYYENGILKLATYVTIGKKKSKTKEGIYFIMHDAINRRSGKFKGEPMPYALQYTGDYFLHRGITKNSEDSHGCIRVPGLYQKWLYENIPGSKRTVIIIHKPYKISLYK